MVISLVIPSRNNLKYLKWAYNAINKHKGEVEVEICIGDDASTDGTWEWCEEMMKVDPMFKAIQNPGPERLGLTLLYNRLAVECATGDIIGIYHADMYLGPNALKYVLDLITPKCVVALTRIEPPLHPEGREKVIKDFGLEPESFQEEEFLDWLSRFYLKRYTGQVTDGVFAPWFIYKGTFLEVGMHDKLFAPTSKEDSDIWNRLLLLGVDFKQTWDGVVYHMTCRGSRFNPTLTTPGVSSEEWLKQNKKSERNFIRKWGNVPFHSAYMRPVITEAYFKTVAIRNATLPIIHALEPWFQCVIVDDYDNAAKEYIRQEQPNTLFNIADKVKHIAWNDPEEIKKGIVITVDALNFTKDNFLLIQQLNSKLKTILQQAKDQPLPLILVTEDENMKIVINELIPLESNYTFNVHNSNQ